MSGTPGIERYVENIQKFAAPLPDYRRMGLEALEQWGLPHSKQEDWRYTSLEPFLPQDIHPAPLAGKGLSSLPAPLNEGIVFCNGHHRPELCRLPVGVGLAKNQPRLFEKASRQDSFEALNMATLASVITLDIAAGKRLDQPFCLLHTVDTDGAGKLMSPHTEIVAGAGSHITLLEIFTHSEKLDRTYQNNGMTKIRLDEGAHVEHVRIVLESPHALHVSKVRANLAARARLTGATFSLSGGLARNNIDIRLDGEEACADVRGLVAINRRQHHDNFTCVSHNKKNTRSRQLFKYMLDDSSRGVFTGKIAVDRGCPGVDSRLLNKNLLLSPKAHADTRPQLEVYTDDVQCNHGATTGQISPEELFYLESRGINPAAAKQILCRAFSERIVAQSSNPLVRNLVGRLVLHNFERRSHEG